MDQPEIARRVDPLWHLGHPHDGHLPFYELPEGVSPPVPRRTLLAAFLSSVVLGVVCAWLRPIGDAAPAPAVTWPWTIPFALLLACVALAPLVAKRAWERFYWVASLGLGLLAALHHVLGLGAAARLAKGFGDYVSFIFLLGSLFVVSGGILIRVRRTATPAVNVAMLLGGAVLSNVLGTTGAAMLLARPYLRINRQHIRPYHVVFFIFIVANMGGALTPIGDPPLFLGYLKGVPFWWVLQHGWPIWAIAVAVTVSVFFVLDVVQYRREGRPPHAEHDRGPAVSIYGAGNLLFIALILVAIFLPQGWREPLMALAACGSLAITPRRVHGENHFSLSPIKEVAVLFLGIFSTMAPALDYLHHESRSNPELRVLLRTPGRCFFVTGALSSVLDNAPTYLTLLESELGGLDPATVARAKRIVLAPTRAEPGPEDFAGLDAEQQRRLGGALDALRRYHGDAAVGGRLGGDAVEVGFLLGDPRLRLYLLAISMGAVFFGACTYIGNGPNFMVKSIAEHAGITCPSFIGYVLKYTIPVLVPTFALVWWVFLR